MLVSVVGAGAIGGTIAALLDRAGHDVSVTARGESLEAIGQDGIHLSGAWCEHHARVVATEFLEDRPGIAFVCAKAQDAPTAISANAALLVEITVVVVQNGLDGLDTARGLLPDSTCVGAVAVFAADRPAPGQVNVVTPGPMLLGDRDGDPSPAAREAAEILGAAMPASAVANFAGHEWTKLIINQVNAVPALTGMSAQEVLADRRLRRIIAASMREAALTGLALGVRFGPIRGLSHGMLRLMTGPLGVAELFLLASRRRLGPTPVTGSTLQSVRRGQSTEIDHLNGAVVSRAQGTGRTAPVNAALTKLVHDVERTHRLLTKDEVVDRVGPLVSRWGR